MNDEKKSLAAHRGEAALWVNPEQLAAARHDIAQHRMSYVRAWNTDYPPEGATQPLYDHPPQVQAEDVAVLTETTIGKAFLSVLADPSHQWRFTGAKTFIDMVAALATEEPNDGWHPLSNPLPNSPIIEQAQAGAGDGVKTGTVADYPDDYLLRRAVRHIARKGRRREVAWARVMDVFGLGSTYSAQLCCRFGIDPETGKDSAALEASHEPE